MAPRLAFSGNPALSKPLIPRPTNPSSRTPVRQLPRRRDERLLAPPSYGVSHLALDVALRLAVGDVAPAVVQLLASREPELDLGPAPGADVEAQRHDREALRCGAAHELV